MDSSYFRLCVAWKGSVNNSLLFLQTWTQLNHMNVTLSYDAILKRVNEISQQHNHLDCFGRLSKAKKPKDDMHACQDALLILTVFKGHIVAAACRELNIGGPEGDIKDIIVNMSLLNDLTVKVARRFTVIPEAFLNESVAN